MIHLKKGRAPSEFEEWKAMATAEWTPLYEALQRPEKLALHHALLAEQGWVCCYCGTSIDSTDSHIEHFRPQKTYEDLALDFQNLLASCIRETKRSTPLHCGHAKEERFDEQLHIAPFDANCESHFATNRMGELIPVDESDIRACHMIELLKLQIPSLRNRRKEVIEHALDLPFIESASRDELASIRDAFREPGPDGRRINFGHVVAMYAEQLLADLDVRAAESAEGQSN